MTSNFTSLRSVARAKASRARGLLVLLLVSSVFLPAPHFTALIASLYIFYALSTNAHDNGLALKLAMPFILLGLLGALMSFDNDQYLILKDTWYVAKIALCLGLGMLLGQREEDFSDVARFAAIIGLTGSLLILMIMIGQQFFTISWLKDSPKIPMVCLLAVPVIFEYIKFQYGIYRIKQMFFLTVILFTILFSDSRIKIIATLILIIGWSGAFSSFRTTLISISVFAAVAFAVWGMLPEYQGGDLTAFNKMQRSFEEILPTDGFDEASRLLNWRGFEAFNAQIMFEQGSIWQQIFGFGLGAEVDLGVRVEMSEEMVYQYLPTLHNGFYFILIKFGVIGVILYFSGIISWFQWSKIPDQLGLALPVRILRGLVMVVIASTMVITGLFNKNELHGVTIFVAYIIGYISVCLRNGANTRWSVLEVPPQGQVGSPRGYPTHA